MARRRLRKLLQGMAMRKKMPLLGMEIRKKMLLLVMEMRKKMLLNSGIILKRITGSITFLLFTLMATLWQRVCENNLKQSMRNGFSRLI